MWVTANMSPTAWPTEAATVVLCTAVVHERTDAGGGKELLKILPSRGDNKKKEQAACFVASTN